MAFILHGNCRVKTTSKLDYSKKLVLDSSSRELPCETRLIRQTIKRIQKASPKKVLSPKACHACRANGIVCGCSRRAWHVLEHLWLPLRSEELLPKDWLRLHEWLFRQLKATERNAVPKGWRQEVAFPSCDPALLVRLTGFLTEGMIISWTSGHKWSPRRWCGRTL